MIYITNKTTTEYTMASWNHPYRNEWWASSDYKVCSIAHVCASPDYEDCRIAPYNVCASPDYEDCRIAPYNICTSAENTAKLATAGLESNIQPVKKSNIDSKLLSKPLKFIVGEKYILKTQTVSTEFICKQIIQSMNDTPLNIVIMKAVLPNDSLKFTLTPGDCRKLHIKYEPGLEVYSMDLNWTKSNAH